MLCSHVVRCFNNEDLLPAVVAVVAVAAAVEAVALASCSFEASAEAGQLFEEEPFVEVVEPFDLVPPFEADSLADHKLAEDLEPFGDLAVVRHSSDAVERA